MRAIGLSWIFLGILAALGEWLDLAFPTARWFFSSSRSVPWLHFQVETAQGDQLIPWFGWLAVALLIIGGAAMVVRSFLRGPKNPITERRLKNFRAIKRGYRSLIILIVLAGLAALDQAVVGKRALAVKYQDEWVFPAFLNHQLKNKDFGIDDETAQAPADYRRLQKIFQAEGRGKVFLPLIPYDPTGETLPPRSRDLVQREGVYYETGSRKPFWGLATRYHDQYLGRMHLRVAVRNGRLAGAIDGWDIEGNPVLSGEYRGGKLLNARYTGAGEVEEFMNLPTGDWRSLKYHPAPPLPKSGELHGNWLGTTSHGYDVLAYIYGGLQVNFKAALIFLPIVYFIGITVGMMMGYFGGWFDILTQRLIEIFSNMPYLFIVIIFSSQVPDKFKGLPVILTILIAFGWMGMTYLMRTAAYRDKERDYVLAARVLGAGTPRILFRHLLPNTVAIIVTLVPFTFSSLVLSLTSLDYLGFGLPPEYATWGRLLNDGLSNLSAPWLVTSTFIVLVSLLVLITFIGEAVREAFDPKKFTYYR